MAKNESGLQFEKWIEDTHQIYRDTGVAWVTKQHVQCVTIFVNGKIQWRPIGKALPDYGGWLKSGRGVLFEAKSIKNKNTWAFPRDREHQYRHLKGALDFNLVPFYLIHWYSMDEVRLFHARHLPEWKSSLRRGDGILIDTESGLVDWLDALVNSGLT